MSIQIYQQKIYLVAEATNCDDIIKTIMEDARKFNVDLEGLEKEKYPKLDDVGIKETLTIMRNDEVKSILGINKPQNIDEHILTVLESPAIEMGLIMYNEFPKDFTIYPVPFLSSKSGVYNRESLDGLKDSFGGAYNTSKYWERRNLSANIDKYVPTLKTKVPNLNWKLTNEKVSFKEQTRSGIKNINKTISRGSLGSFMFNKFQEIILFPLIRSKIDSTPNNNLNNTTTYDNINAKELLPIVIIANYDTIRDFINQVKAKKYSAKSHKIERSSVWEIEMKITRKIQSGTLTYTYDYINHQKRYPTEFVSKNLDKNDEKYKIKLRGKKYELVDIGKRIPIEYVIDMDCKHCKNNKKMINILKQIAKKIRPNNNKNKNNKNLDVPAKENYKLTQNINNYQEAVDVLTVD